MTQYQDVQRRRVSSNLVALYNVRFDWTFQGIWDTAGAEKFESISEQYTRNSNAAIICYDVTDKPTFEKAKQWVSKIYLPLHIHFWVSSEASL